MGMYNGRQKRIHDKYRCVRCPGYRNKIVLLQKEITVRGDELHQLKKDNRKLRKQLKEAKK